MPLRKSNQESSEHFHNWSDGFNPDEKVCRIRLGRSADGTPRSCGAILVSQKEYDRRIKEWNSYFKLVESTPAYFRYQEIRMAKEERNETRVKELAREAGEALGKDDYLPRPSFPDPSTWGKYVTVEP